MYAWTLAQTAAGPLAQLGYIFYFILLPMLLLAGIGFGLQRKLGLDLPTLTRLNFYLVIPAAVYTSIIESRLSAGDVGQVVLFAVVFLATMTALSWLLAVIRRVPPGQRPCLLMTGMFGNTGNYGLPLQDLAFRGAGACETAVSLQAVFMIVGNVANFTVGILLAARGGSADRHWKQNLLHIAKLPPLYALAAGVITVQVRSLLGDGAPATAEAIQPFWDVVSYIRGGFVAVALVTLGAQLGSVRPAEAKYPIGLSVILRLLIAPAAGLALVLLLGIEGFLAQVMVIACCTPTAVNVLLLCMEFDNYPDYAARAVFYSSLLSPLTVAAVVFFAQGGFVPALQRPAAPGAATAPALTAPAPGETDPQDIPSFDATAP